MRKGVLVGAYVPKATRKQLVIMAERKQLNVSGYLRSIINEEIIRHNTRQFIEDVNKRLEQTNFRND